MDLSVVGHMTVCRSDSVGAGDRQGRVTVIEVTLRGQDSG
jgi:hypothetical protein